MQASFVQKQQFGVKMNPQMYQSIKLMELPLVDLREKIEEELERNPALEVLEDKSTVSLDEAELQPGEEEEYFETSSDPGYINKTAGAEASDEHHRFIEGVLVRPETLQQHLLWQLQLEPVDSELRAVAAILIQNLDDDGFHKEPPETLFKKNNDSSLRTAVFPDISPAGLDEAMRLVQALDPAGCCTGNYRESLKVQVALLGNALKDGATDGAANGATIPPCMTEALDYLELFEKGKFSGAAKRMKCSEEDARICFELIKKLTPFPGRVFTAAEVRFVIPDVQVVRDYRNADGDFVIILNDEVVPVLGISPFFDQLAPAKQGGGKDSPAIPAALPAAMPVALPEAERQAGEFARENVKEARFFINSLAMRNNTLKMVARAILKFQRPFFENGPQHLLPLSLGDIAGLLGVHEATVSRTANGKYMQTEWGIFELRYFFTNSISGSGSNGSSFSKEGVKAVIQELIGTEKRSLSDHDICELLAGRGISLARRTVAKYRKELDLGSSYTR